MANVFSSLIGGSGGPNIFGEFATAAGDFAEGSAYGQAAKYADINAGIAKEEGAIKLAQTQRDIFKVLGQQQAGYAGAGFASGGSAMDVQRSSVQQGALQKAIVGEQTQINVTGYEEQAAQFKGLEAASNAAGTGNILGGIFGILSLI
jgi:hypothetical protein